MLKIVGAVACLVAMTGCTRVETGSVGIVKHWGGKISSEPVTGFNLTLLDSILVVDTTETRLPINNLRPADANGVLLDDLDLVASFRINAAKAPAFYIATKEVDDYKDESGRTITTLGLHILQNIIRHATQEVTKSQSLVTLAANLSGYENAILAQSQRELDAGSPGVFKLVRINVNNFVPPGSIRAQADRAAALRGERERNEQELALIAQRQRLEQSKAIVDAAALKSAMDATHLSASEIIAWKNAEALAELARHTSGPPPTVMVNAPRPAQER